MKTRVKVTFSSSGPTGNIYSILGAVHNELRKVGRLDEFEKIQNGVMASQSYAAAIAVIRESVDLVDTDGKV